VKKQEVLSLLQEQVDIMWHTVQKYSWVRVGVVVTECSIITMCYIMITAIWHSRWVSCDHPITFYTPESDMLCVLSVQGGIQNFPEWCRHLFSSCGSAKHH